MDQSSEVMLPIPTLAVKGKLSFISMEFVICIENAEDCDTKNFDSNGILNDDDFSEEKGNFSSDWKRRSSFDLEQLVGVVRDLFVAGIDTTATTLMWLLLYLSKYPEFQKKLHDEIDDVLGHSGVPRMATMEKMPYVRAVIQVAFQTA